MNAFIERQEKRNRGKVVAIFVITFRTQNTMIFLTVGVFNDSKLIFKKLVKKYENGLILRDYYGNLNFVSYS